MKAIVSLVMVLSIVVSSLSAQSSLPERGPITVILVQDTSSSCRDDRPNCVSLAGRIVSSCLGPGDDLEVISAHSGEPKNRLSLTIKSGSPQQVGSVCSTIRRIPTGFLSNASVARALELALQRLKISRPQEQYRRAVVIVLSDGRLSNSDASRVIGLSEEFRKRGWSLHLTGTKEANKKLLVAAHQGKFSWCLLGEADASLWIPPSPDRRPLDEQEPASTEPVFEAPEEQSVRAEEEPNESEGPEIQHSVDGSATGDQIRKYILKGEIEGPVPVLGPGQNLPAGSVVEPPDVPGEPNESVPDLPQEADGEQQPPPPESEAEEGPSTMLWWILPPAAVLLALLGFVPFKVGRKASQLKARFASILGKGPEADSAILIARFNGQSHRLGPLSQFGVIHFGRDPNNGIRALNDKSIEGRHLKLFGKGGDIWVKNLAKSPVVANGTEVKPGRKHRLVIPAVIQLNDKTRLTLELLRQKQGAPANRRNQHEHEEK